MDKKEIIEFVEWISELLPIEYDGDSRRRFTPQIIRDNEDFVWIETHKFNSSNVKFYKTGELYDLFLNEKYG